MTSGSSSATPPSFVKKPSATAAVRKAKALLASQLPSGANIDTASSPPSSDSDGAPSPKPTTKPKPKKKPPPPAPKEKPSGSTRPRRAAAVYTPPPSPSTSSASTSDQSGTETGSSTDAFVPLPNPRPGHGGVSVMRSGAKRSLKGLEEKPYFASATAEVWQNRQGSNPPIIDADRLSEGWPVNITGSATQKTVAIILAHEQSVVRVTFTFYTTETRAIFKWDEEEERLAFWVGGERMPLTMEGKWGQRTVIADRWTLDEAVEKIRRRSEEGMREQGRTMLRDIVRVLMARKNRGGSGSEG